MATEKVTLEFTDGAVTEIAKICERVNQDSENIGARRLHTIMECLIEDLSFQAPECNETEERITAEVVEKHLADIVEDRVADEEAAF